MDVFEYRIEIEDDRAICSNYEIGNFWAVVEEFGLPESLVSDKGAFLFKLIEDDENLLDVWILAMPHNEDILASFLRKELNYGKFLKNSDLFVVYWDLNEDKVYIQKAINLDELKELNKSIENILNLTIVPSSDLKKILKYVVPNVYTQYAPNNRNETSPTHIENIGKDTYTYNRLVTCIYGKSSDRIKITSDLHVDLYKKDDADDLLLAA